MEKSNKNAKCTSVYALFGIIFCVLFALFMIFPITGDDWFREDLGRSVISIGNLFEKVAEKYTSTNGRIMGNILAYSAGSRPILKVLYEAFFTVLLIFGVCKALSVSSAAGILTAFAATFALPLDLFKEIYPWAAGFFNYLPPVSLLLLAFYLMDKEFRTTEKHSFLNYTAVFFLVLLSQLFMENYTLYTVCAGIAILFYCLIAKNKAPAALYAFIIGAFLGAAVLLLSPSYKAVASTGGAYQSGLAGGIGGLIHSAKENHYTVFHNLVSGNPVIFLSITALSGIAAFKSSGTRGKISLAAFLPAAVCCIYFILRYFFNLFTVEGYVNSALCILWLAAVSVLCLSAIDDKLLSLKALYFTLSACVAAAPLLFVSPIGPRCLFMSYVFLVIAAGCFVPIALGDGIDSYKALIISAAISIAIVFMCAYVYLPMRTSQTEREELILAAMEEGTDSVTVPVLPNGKYVWEPDTYKMEYYYYYETPGDLDIIFTVQKGGNK